jgi:RNA polymerase sigma-70 factor (ECF subfamily)
MRPGDEAPDGELLARYLAGEGRAFDAIVDRYERRVFAVALRMSGDPEDARDITQEVFISAMRALRRFRGDAQLGTWFHRVAINASYDHARRRKRRQAQALEVVGEQPSSEPGPDDEAVAASRAAAVHRALGDLSDDHRAVIVLHDLQGLDYPEVAEALDIPLGTVKSRIHRARLDLAKLLGHLRETEPSGQPGRLRNEP